MCHRTAAVEQAGHRMRQQRAAGRGTRHNFGVLDEVRRHHVDQILRDAPDRRRPLKQLMRVEIEIAVEAIAVVEVALHHHFEPAQVFERAGADLIVTRVHYHHESSSGRDYSPAPTLTAGFEYATLPPTMVAATPPLNDQP